MMKSFFKKLSFVMALAMVVSMMAPAGSAFAAEAGIALQGTKEVVTEYNVEKAGEEVAVDFCFLGAPADWKTTYKWASSDETVATVDKAGKVTALKDGEATITITAGADASYKHEVKLTVGTKKEDKSFTVKQTTSNTVEITFADKAFATKDITVEKLGKTVSGDVTEMVWPVNKVELKDNVATVTTWVNFGTGEYRFTANEIEVDKATAVGNPFFAVVTYKDTYSYADNGNKAIAPEIKVYDENGVLLTGYNNWYFELVNTEANAYVENTTGNLYLWAVGAKAQIKATLTYYVGTEAKTIECPVEVNCVAVPEYTVNGYLEKFALVKAGTAADKITWNKTDVILNDGSYYVAGIVKDSLNKTNSISTISVDNNNPVLDVNKYYVKYASSNPSVALVDETDGQVIGVNEGPVYILVSLYKVVNAADRSKDVNIGVIAAVPVNVCAARKATYLTLDSYGATRLTSGHFTTATVTATIKDQYQTDSTDTLKAVYAKVNDVTYNATINGNKFTVDAAAFADVNVNAVNYTVETNSGLKANFVFTIKKLPAMVNQQYTLTVAGAEISTDATKTEASVKVTSAWAGNSLYNTAFYYGKPAECKVGDLYVTITGPDGKDLTSTTAATVSALTFDTVDNASVATSGAIKTMATGNYAVKLMQVTNIATGTDGKQIVNTTVCDSKVFLIKDSLAKVSDFKVKNNKYTAADVIDTTNVEFKVGDVAWDGANFKVVNVNKKELNGSAYVYDFTVQIPYGTDGAYYTVKVPVNQLFTK